MGHSDRTRRGDTQVQGWGAWGVENERRKAVSPGAQYASGRGLRKEGQNQKEPWTRGRSSQGQQRAPGFHPLLAGAWKCSKEIEVSSAQTWEGTLPKGG